MSRRALSLSTLLLLSMAPAAHAEGNRSLGVTVSPVGAFVSVLARDAMPAGLAPVNAGYAACVDWAFHKAGSHWLVGGHVSANQLETEATPVSIRFTPFPRSRVLPYAGVGASLLLPTSPSAGSTPDALLLRLGAEASVGLDVLLSDNWFLAAQGRYQDFSLDDSPFSAQRQHLLSAYLGVGVRL